MVRKGKDPDTHLAHVFYLKEHRKHHPDVQRSEKNGIRKASHNFTKGQGQDWFYIGPKGDQKRLFVHKNDRPTILQECHNNPARGGHCGITITQKKVEASYYWSGITKDVKKWVKNCDSCQHVSHLKTKQEATTATAISSSHINSRCSTKGAQVSPSSNLTLADASPHADAFDTAPSIKKESAVVRHDANVVTIRPLQSNAKRQKRRSTDDDSEDEREESDVIRLERRRLRLQEEQLRVLKDMYEQMRKDSQRNHSFQEAFLDIQRQRLELERAATQT